ncbi:hypothetical protein BK007_06680 [Methanobacterium subterraneum]|jgi:hypothetical protein|uniref:Uncharacterized protein n=1 Tax=Methanobacterium subterraneum TaxID=59277 RepID=A0A2H4VQP1_9EURY|nr:hypothetical protein BK007_06680 [Methanobacterium subterraneum]AUB60418.1 hypothetical protein BK009_06815 [Methanobacterium subterraneum]MBW4258185.1 hypothetical protein [Methanobacterium sp. YSL]
MTLKKSVFHIIFISAFSHEIINYQKLYINLRPSREDDIKPFEKKNVSHGTSLVKKKYGNKINNRGVIPPVIFEN